MAITVTCPSCGTASQVADAAAGARGSCRACGTSIQVPSRLKVCCMCGADVSGQPRTKDSQGLYYCGPCWSHHQGAVSDADVSDGEPLACPDCGGVFTVEQMDASGVCTGCAVKAARTSQPTRPRKVKPSFWRTDAGIITAIVTPIAIIGLATIGWLQWPLNAGMNPPSAGQAISSQHEQHQSDAEQQRSETARAELHQREANAARDLLTKIEPFTSACTAFRVAYDEFNDRSGRAVLPSDLKAALDSEQRMLEALRDVNNQAARAQEAVDAVAPEFKTLRIQCDLIKVTVSDMRSAYEKYS